MIFHRIPIPLLVLTLCAGLLLLPATGHTQEWHVKQGDLLRATLSPPPGINTLHVRAFGKSWPSEKLENGKTLAWVGIDLDTKTGTHPLNWSSDEASNAWSQEDNIVVNDGEFQKSYITVGKAMAEPNAEDTARILADQAAFKRAYQTKVGETPDISFVTMPTTGVISSPFGARRFVNKQPRSAHAGIDIAAAEGTPIVAPLAGKVLLVESMFLNGNAIAIGHGRGLVTIYTHMQDLQVKQGQWVSTGEQVGSVGKTGRVTGPHLHWGVRFQGARINPLDLIPRESQEHKP